MRSQTLFVISTLIVSQLLACAPHRAAHVEARVAELAKDKDQPQPHQDQPNADKTPALTDATFDELDQQIQARTVRLNDMDFYSMDDNYSVNTWRGFWKGTKPQNRPVINELLNEVKVRVDRMLVLASDAKSKVQLARAQYLQKNVERCLRKMAVLASLEGQ